MAAPANRILWLIPVVLAAAAIAAVGWFTFAKPTLQARAADELGVGDYQLVATDGTDFTQDTLLGAPSAVFFGFTHCPEVCPTTLSDIGVWKDEIGEEADDLRVYFVTVDPERDTGEALEAYVGWLDGALGVTGSRAEIDKAQAAFRIYSRKVDTSDGDYTMDHSAYVMLFDAEGRFFEPVGYQEDFERAVGKLRRLLEG